MKVYLIFTVRVILYTLILAGVIFLLQKNRQTFWIHELIWAVVWFYFGWTLLSGLLTLYFLRLSKDNSVPILLGTGLFRLLGSLGFVFVVLWMGTENLLWFVVDFFIIYLLYLLFDIYTFITNLRPHSE